MMSGNNFEALAATMLDLEQYYGPDDTPLIPEDKEEKALAEATDSLMTLYMSNAAVNPREVIRKVVKKYGEYSMEEE